MRHKNFFKLTLNRQGAITLIRVLNTFYEMVNLLSERVAGLVNDIPH